MENSERPWELLKAVARESVRQMEMMRFYLQLAKDPHGSSIALFVGNLPPNLSQRQYDNILSDILGNGEGVLVFPGVWVCCFVVVGVAMCGVNEVTV